MPAQSIPVLAGTRSAPVFVSAGSSVSVTPASGGTVLVEYTTGSATDVQNNVATWANWPMGATVVARTDIANEPMMIRATATNAAAKLTLNDGPGLIGALVRDWASQSNIGTVAVLGQQHLPVSKSDLDANESAALYTLTIPGGTLGPNSTLAITTLWTVPSSAATKRLRHRFGGNVLLNVDLATSVAFQYKYIIRNRNSLSSQIAQPNNTLPYSTFGASAVQTFAVDFSASQDLTITAQWPVAGAGANNITLESAIVEHLFGA